MGSHLAGIVALFVDTFGEKSSPADAILWDPMPSTERIREFLLELPHVVETMQFGDNLVFWVGDKAIGGKMFVMLQLSSGGISGSAHSETKGGVLWYPAGPERYPELLEIEGIFPAPYLARIHWVAVREWRVFRPAEWEQELRAAHQITYAKLPPKTLKALALPIKQRRKLIVERRAILAKKKPAKK